MAKRNLKRSKIKIKDLQIQDTKVNFRFIIIVILIIFIILSFLGILSNFSGEKEVVGVQDNEYNEQPRFEDKENLFFSLAGSTRVKMYLPAVDDKGNGVNTILTVEATKGSGRTLTDIDNLLFWADTQHSIRIARKVAENITGKKMGDFDIVYTIEANASLIGGPSAGAALAVATIAALEGKPLSDKVMITGSINHDGSIGPVSAILEKAKVAKEKGATLFLVPLLQSRDVVYETSEHCEEFGSTKICSSETKPKKIDVSAEAGIEVKEVETIKDAMVYFLG